MLHPSFVTQLKNCVCPRPILHRIALHLMCSGLRLRTRTGNKSIRCKIEIIQSMKYVLVLLPFNLLGNTEGALVQ